MGGGQAGGFRGGGDVREHPDRDEKDKRKLYQRLGVREHWQFDPSGDYLDPILKGQRLGAGNAYAAIRLETGADGVLYGMSDVLCLHVCVHGDRLRYRAPKTGEYLPTLDDHRRQVEHKDRRIERQDQQLTEKDRVNAEQVRALDTARAEIESLQRRLAGR